jgi:phospholipase C
VVEALTANPEVWSKTVLLINYDENDGFFDHMPPPLPAASPAMGASTVSVEGELYDGQPVGLGPRVPMIVVSPFSTGGWVNSQVFDHTSVIRFLEARFGVEEPNISPWRRAVTGDLTSAFDFSKRNARAPILPDTRQHAARVAAACKLAKPAPPATFLEARQETGLRPARPLPYALDVSTRNDEKGLVLTFANSGIAGAAFNVYHASGATGPWFYTVEAGKSLTGVWAPTTEGEVYDFTAHGPNGFMRAFRGRHGVDAPGVQTAYDAARQHLVVSVRNPSSRPLEVAFAPGDYPGVAPRRRTVAAGQTVAEAWPVRASAHWYDIVLTLPSQPDFLYRLAGHVETGAASFSDPAIGRA